MRKNEAPPVDRTQDTFIDYYELMQISPNAEQETIQRVYRMLAARYHPDNPETGDTDRFLLLGQAYRLLSDPEARAAYEATYAVRRLEPLNVFNLKEFAVGIDGEGNRRMGILCLLYNRRRADADDPGISLLEFETLMSFPREHLVFTLWYLKEKGFLRQGEESDYLITSAGIDYVEEKLPANGVLYHLLKAAETGNAWSASPERGAS
ncbi:MAG TPA: DnaJ domain-containing protein [Bryobacteraceae bacterium]|jgi:curved DNA-binding protein CbpA|nr:DnaJ domain-containing protein [Bryobacteraceae bacterium]